MTIDNAFIYTLYMDKICQLKFIKNENYIISQLFLKQFLNQNKAFLLNEFKKFCNKFVKHYLNYIQ